MKTKSHIHTSNEYYLHFIHGKCLTSNKCSLNWIWLYCFHECILQNLHISVKIFLLIFISSRCLRATHGKNETQNIWLPKYVQNLSCDLHQTESPKITKILHLPGTVSPLNFISTRWLRASCGTNEARNLWLPRLRTKLVTWPPLTKISKLPEPAPEPSTGRGERQNKIYIQRLTLV